jgi:hypothetical protein
MRYVHGGNMPIMFGDARCPACQAQIELLNIKIGKGSVIYYDLSRFPPPKCITSADGSYSMPSWYLPCGQKSIGYIKKKRFDMKLILLLVVSIFSSNVFAVKYKRNPIAHDPQKDSFFSGTDNKLAEKEQGPQKKTNGEVS